MQNFKFQHQTSREVKMLVCLLQPIILILTTNPLRNSEKQA